MMVILINTIIARIAVGSMIITVYIAFINIWWGCKLRKDYKLSII